MKKILSMLLCVNLLLTFVACMQTQPDPTGKTDAPSAGTTEGTTAAVNTEATIPPVSYQAPMTALSVPIAAEEYRDEDGNLLFTYSSQEFSLILEDPHVAEEITLDYLNRVDFSNSAAQNVYEAAKAAYTGQTDWIPYFYSELYSPVRLDQSVLSLYGSEILYDGSMRSTSVDLSVTYDLLTGTVLEEITEILVLDYSAETLCQLIIDALKDRADSGALFADYEYIISDLFTTNTPMETWYFSETGLCFYFRPYDIAPYSEGTIVAEVIYEDLNGLLKDQYFPSEQADLYGTVIVEALEDSSNFTQIAEVVLDTEGEQYVIRTDGTLFDLRLVLQVQSEDDDAPTNAVTVLAAASLSAGDAIVVQCTKDSLGTLRLDCHAGGTTIAHDLAALASLN